MFRKKDKPKGYSVPYPPNHFESVYGHSAVADPWGMIEDQRSKLRSEQERSGLLTTQLHSARRDQLLEYLGSYGYYTTESGRLSGLPTWEHDDTIYPEVPKGWGWAHEAEQSVTRTRTWSDSAYMRRSFGYPYDYRGDYDPSLGRGVVRPERPVAALAGTRSIVKLVTPENKVMGQLSSRSLDLPEDRAFKRHEIYVACLEILHNLLPIPAAEQPAPMGTVRNPQESRND